MKLLMLSQDNSIARGERGSFYHMLKEFSQYWDEIHIICPKISGISQTSIHGNVFIYPSTFGQSFLRPLYAYRKGREIYEKGGYDLMSVHGGFRFLNEIGAWLLWRQTRVPYVIEIHHVTGFPRAGDWQETLARVCTRLFIKYLCAKAKAVRVVNNEETPEFLIRCGIPKDKIRCISSSIVDFDIFRPLVLKTEVQRIIFCGRLATNKGIFELLKAFKIVTAQYPEARLTIIGRGELEDRLKKFVRTQGMSDSVEFKGWLPETQDVAAIYNKSGVFVLTSYSEGGPRVTLEAMACEVPVISTKVGIMRELIRDGENGYLVDWDPRNIARKIIYLFEHEEERRRIAIQGRKSILDSEQKFELKQVVRNYAETYQRIAQET